MANLKEIRTRITSVSSTKQITSAMKMVAAAKLRKAQSSILQIRPYVNKLQEILTHISSGMDAAEDNIYAQQREIKSVLIITMAAVLCSIRKSEKAFSIPSCSSVALRR